MTKSVKWIVIIPLSLMPFFPFALIVTDALQFKGSGLFRTDSLICDLFLVPPVLLAILYKANPNTALSFVFLWAMVCSWGVIKATAKIINKEERGATEASHPFDWWRFWVRFVCGAFLGSIIGWRMWISLSRNATASAAVLFICIAVGAIAAGLLVAFAREDFWKRP